MTIKAIGSIYRVGLAVPLAPVLVVLAVLVWAGFSVPNLAFDSSTENFIAEDDPDLAIYQDTIDTFGSDEFIVLTYAPKSGDLVAKDTLADIDKLQAEILTVPGVAGVTTLLDVPLLRSPPAPLDQLTENIRTLRAADTDLPLAQQELMTSPLYRNLVVSGDGTATAFQIDLTPNDELSQLIDARRQLTQRGQENTEAKSQLRSLNREYAKARLTHTAQRETLIATLRDVAETRADRAEIHISGVPVIASDMITYVRSDVEKFGLAAAGLVMLTLLVFFRRLRWMVLPIATAGSAALITAGTLAALGQPITAISSSFISLLIIFSTAFSVHLIVRYRELHHLPTRRAQVARMMADKAAPGFYAALTTIVAFASLTVSSVLPIRTFGWTMCLATAVAFVMNMVLFPALLTLLPRPSSTARQHRPPLLTQAFRVVATGTPRLVIAAALLLTVAGGVGITKLTAENRLVDYFRQGTEIREGLTVIDERFGGTTTMEVVVTFEPFVPNDDLDDDFFAEEPDPYPERYWFTANKIETLNKVTTYLEQQPGVGKVTSVATLEAMARDFTGGERLSSLELAGVIGAIPADLRDGFLAPYAAPEKGLMRINLRLQETQTEFSRTELIEGLRAFTKTEGLGDDNVQITGINVLFSNMLDALVVSQSKTIGVVVLATFLMFLLLLRSVKLAVIGLLPNILSAGVLLGSMGFLGIQLDMLTVTIAAIIVGIGVDNSFHYLDRFRAAIDAGDSVKAAITTAHSSTGVAIYATTITVIVGFSVLALSNFVPTQTFGILTAGAMVMSLLANLLILPSLLRLFYDSAAAGTAEPVPSSDKDEAGACPIPPAPIPLATAEDTGGAEIAVRPGRNGRQLELVWRWVDDPNTSPVINGKPPEWEVIPQLFHRRILATLSVQDRPLAELVALRGLKD